VGGAVGRGLEIARGVWMMRTVSQRSRVDVDDEKRMTLRDAR